MPNYKEAIVEQGRFVSVQFSHQIQPGTFEHALNHIVDRKLNLSVLDAHFKNDHGGTSAYDPRVLLKIVLFAYSRGILSSRDIADACRQNVVFMALSAASQPHFTTIARFISSLGEAIVPLFRDILLYCDELGLIGKEMFAIDGCKIASNASKEWSGTRQDFERKKTKFQESMAFLLKKHQAEDDAEKNDSSPRGSVNPGPRREQELKAIERLQAKLAKVDAWLSSHDDRRGADGRPIKSNITDPDSAKMLTSHGVIQGYNGVAAVDDKHQVIVAAQAFGEGSEVGVLEPLVDKVKEAFDRLGEPDIYNKAVITADSGYHSEKNMALLERKGVNAYIADQALRRRDPRFLTADRHKEQVHDWKKKYRRKYFAPADFPQNPQTGDVTCPAGKTLWLKDKEVTTANGFVGSCYMAHLADCRGCELRTKCLRVSTTKARQVYKFRGRDIPAEQMTFTKKMIAKMDTFVGRYLYSRRMGAVEPVFGNIRHMLGLDRFTLRGKHKVNIQWTLYSAVHNLLKIHRFGLAGAG